MTSDNQIATLPALDLPLMGVFASIRRIRESSHRRRIDACSTKRDRTGEIDADAAQMQRNQALPVPAECSLIVSAFLCISAPLRQTG